MDGREELNLPHCHRFSPTRSELVVYYLKNKILGQVLPADIIPTIDLYLKTPDQLPLSDFKYGCENEWFFFTTRPNGNLITNDGYYTEIWEEDEDIIDRSTKKRVGFMRKLSFQHCDQLPKVREYRWVIYEHRVDPDIIPADQLDDSTLQKVSNFVACKVVRKKLKFPEAESKSKSL